MYEQLKENSKLFRRYSHEQKSWDTHKVLKSQYTPCWGYTDLFASACRDWGLQVLVHAWLKLYQALCLSQSRERGLQVLVHAWSKLHQPLCLCQSRWRTRYSFVQVCFRTSVGAERSKIGKNLDMYAKDCRMLVCKSGICEGGESKFCN